MAELSHNRQRFLSWGVLLALLVANLGAALFFNPSAWPGLVGDEATYMMQAESLAFDFDLAYSKEDYDRFVRRHGQPPEGLILQSRDGGGHIVYSKPLLYALVLAPASRISPRHGPQVMNALVLALAAVLAAAALERRQGAMAPLWVAVWVFASVAFAYTFWSHADLFLMSCTAAGFALATGGGAHSGTMAEIYDAGEAPAGWRFALRWLAVGALLAIPGAFRPFYLTLLLPGLMLVPQERRWKARGWLLLAVLVVVGGGAAAQWASGGNWSSYAGERQGFYVRTGFPDVDFPAGEWDRSVERWGNTSWVHEGMFDVDPDPRLVGWDAAYFLVGQNIGVVPYFFPLWIGLLAGGWSRARGWIVLAVALAVLGFFLFRPFNFYGGAGAIANRYFLPLYPALWFGGRRSLRASWALVAVLGAAPFLWPTWAQPWAFPVREGGGYHHVTALAERYLPYETTQSHLPRASEDVIHNGLWLRFPDSQLWPEKQGAQLRLLGGAEARLLISSPTPLDSLDLDLRPPATTDIEVRGGELVGQMVFRPDGSFSVTLRLEEASRRHPMWWTREPQYLYLLHLRMLEAPARPVPLSIRPR